MLTEDQIKEIFLKADAFLEGHFLLSSGLHSPYYLQCARVLQYPNYAETLCSELARRIKELGIEFDLVIAPAIGGIIVSYETARHLGVRGIFAERVDGKLTLRRGFEIKKGERAVVVEDVVTTGKSTRETIEVVKEHGGEVVAVGSLVDRSGGKADFGGIPFTTLWRLEVPVYQPESCPLCREGKLPLVKPGSRNIPLK
jgi:orotate phosphoribosyltransferase